jgi:hypothetical protein
MLSSASEPLRVDVFDLDRNLNKICTEYTRK